MTAVALLALGSAIACGERPADSAPLQTADSVAARAPVANRGPTTASRGPRCIQGGTPREDVRRIMGEPDSVSYGSWLYGSSEIMFGYGVVVETRNAGGNLDLC